VEPKRYEISFLYCRVGGYGISYCVFAKPTEHPAEYGNASTPQNPLDKLPQKIVTAKLLHPSLLCFFIKLDGWCRILSTVLDTGIYLNLSFIFVDAREV